MDRKPYQEAALTTLDQFARRARDTGPHLAFGDLAPREPAYRDQGFGTTPYVCLRLPRAGARRSWRSMPSRSCAASRSRTFP